MRKFCKATTRDSAKVFVTNGRSFLVTNLEGTTRRAFSLPSSMSFLTAVEVHNKTGRIFWSDRVSKAIYSADENGTNVVKVVGSGVSVVEAIAIDWIGENLYWTDYVMEHIEVSRLDGKRRRILLNVKSFFKKKKVK